MMELQELSTNIEDEYVNSDLFVVSSIMRDTGLLQQRLSSTGLPCVGFADCEGTNEIIVDGLNGYLVKVNNDHVSFGFCIK